MEFFSLTAEQTLKYLNSDFQDGLSLSAYNDSAKKYGKNVLSKKKGKSFFSKAIDSLKEPMMLILCVSFIVALIANTGKYIRTGDGDFFEVFGIFCAIVLSVSITLVMEGSSQKAFGILSKVYGNVVVKVVRQGKVIMMNQSSVVVGDVIILESGDKIIADGRLLYSNELCVDESALTGESNSVKKTHDKTYESAVPLAERRNMLYSGTFIVSGEGRMVVTAIGDQTEIGKLAGEIKKEKEVLTPLQQKLADLGKRITAIGVASALFVFIVSLVKLIATGGISYSSVQDLFVSCVILIVAAVPEGLPTIVAVSLALNMIKLTKSNALIKKMIATETTGAVSVICSDKTGTLTKNKMSVLSVCSGEYCSSFDKNNDELLLKNFILNSTADVVKKGKDYIYKGSATECALITAVLKSRKNFNYKKYRESFEIVDRTPFSGTIKYMTTTIKTENGRTEFIKGANEAVIVRCKLDSVQERKIAEEIKKQQNMARRVICFAHKDDGEERYTFDGYAVIADEIREEVFEAVKECKRAGINIKMLTGDNYSTAFSIAKKLDICQSETEVVCANDIEDFSDEQLKRLLPKIKVVARSTPIIKLRIVKALKEIGEVVAVTGDGINDAPAIKHADVGIAMGISGSEITKEAADVVLLDDSFSTIVKAISFGRNVFKNLQRFISFQLSINASAIFIIIASAVFGFSAPFNTLELLWINVIMDGPPALTLGLEGNNDKLMDNKPIKRNDGIIGKKLFIKILFNGLYVGAFCFLQYVFNFLKVGETEKNSAVFTLFVSFGLFNAFNCRELGAESIFNGITKNKIMLAAFSVTFLLQIIIVSLGYKAFGINPLTFLSWCKIIVCSSSVVAISEIYKTIYRVAMRRGGKNDRIKKTEFAALTDK